MQNLTANVQRPMTDDQVFCNDQRTETNDRVCQFVIYHCYGGAHSSVTSSGIYLGLLPRDRVPNTVEILKVPHYDGNEAITHGHFRFMGRDQAGRAVFVLGKGMLGPHINRLLIVIAGIYGCAGNIFSVDTTAPVNLLMIFGGYVSRALKIVSLGRPFVVLGTKLAYFRFVRLASRTEKRLLENCRAGETSLPATLRQVIFYLCPDGFRYPLLTTGFHIHPGASDEQVLCWARRQSFTGAVGSVLFAGVADDYQVYLVGAGRDPVIVGRIIRELRFFLEVPQSDCLVVNPEIRPSYAGFLAARGCRRLGLDRLYRFWEERLFIKKIGACRRESGDVIRRMKEGILD
ncbi:MAG: DUF3189 family protein [Thermacetogeniaceae bacterium]|jgi:hypothetical protein